MSRRHVAVALLCALLVVSAGCSGITGSDDPATTDANEPTTAEGPTATETTATTAEPHEIAPGVTTAGVTDALALADAHRERLRSETWVARDTYRRTNASGTVTRTTTVRYRNESVWLWNRTTEGLPVALGATNGSLVQYADGERVLWRLDAGNATRENTTYGVRWSSQDGDRVPRPPEAVFAEGLYARDLVYALVATSNTSVNTVQGANAYVEGRAASMRLHGERVTDVSFQAAFDNSGRLLRLELTYEEGDATVERRLEFRTVDDPVEQPDWYGAALNETAAGA